MLTPTTRQTGNRRSPTPVAGDPPRSPPPPVHQTATPPAEPEPERALWELAREIAGEFPVPQDATDELERRVRGNRAYNRLLVRSGCAQKIAEARNSMRDNLEHDWLEGRKRGMERYAAAQAGRASLFDWKMPGTGVALGDATVEDLDAAIDYHVNRADAETARADTYRAIRNRLTKAKHATVREAMREKELASLMQKPMAA